MQPRPQPPATLDADRVEICRRESRGANPWDETKEKSRFLPQHRGINCRPPRIWLQREGCPSPAKAKEKRQLYLVSKPADSNAPAQCQQPSHAGKSPLHRPASARAALQQSLHVASLLSRRLYCHRIAIAIRHCHCHCHRAVRPLTFFYDALICRVIVQITRVRHAQCSSDLLEYHRCWRRGFQHKLTLSKSRTASQAGTRTTRGAVQRKGKGRTAGASNNSGKTISWVRQRMHRFCGFWRSDRLFCDDASLRVR